MNIEALIKRIEAIDWLSHSNHISSVLETQFEWDWLPSSRDQDNPFEVTFSDSSMKMSSEKDAEKRVYRAALKSLRKIGVAHPNLVDGANNYTESFKGAALFACKLTAREVSLKQPGQWLDIVGLYEKGRWPCGLRKTGEIVTL